MKAAASEPTGTRPPASAAWSAAARSSCRRAGHHQAQLVDVGLSTVDDADDLAFVDHAMRSASIKISSRSSLIKRMPTPSELARINNARTPPSRPHPVHGSGSRRRSPWAGSRARAPAPLLHVAARQETRRRVRPGRRDVEARDQVIGVRPDRAMPEQPPRYEWSASV